MKLVVEYRMKAYIEAEGLHGCAIIWDNADLEMSEKLRNGKIETEFVDMMSVYEEDTYKEIDIKEFY